MRHIRGECWNILYGTCAGLIALAFLSAAPVIAHGFTLTVVDPSHVSITTGYRWILEEDTTNLVRPGVPDNNSISVSIDRSYCTPVAVGTDNDLAMLDNTSIVDSKKRYIISVLPNQGPLTPVTFTLNSASVAAGQRSVSVLVLPHPLPTAQISVLAFVDNAFINGAPDTPAEPGIPGAKVIVFDQVGQVMQDAFFNPMGTTYDNSCDPTGANPGTGTDFCLGANGLPVVLVPGNGIFTDNTGNAVIKYLYPGKYGIRVVPQDNLIWIQTSTIEGTPGIDTFVTAGGPSQFVEAGFFNVHAFIGFVNPTNDLTTGLPLSYGPKFFAPGNATVKGRVMSVHSNRPPLQPGLEIGRPVVNAWVGLSDTLNGNAAVFAGPCTDNSSFTITGVPPGTYTLTMWDFPLTQIIDYRTVVVTDNNQTLDFGEIPLYRWFGWFAGTVFADSNRNGFRERNPATGEWLEAGISNQVINLRQRDGSLIQTTVTDSTGYYEFSEVFPWYKWIVAERSPADDGQRTGATIWVDNGGKLPTRSTPPVPINFANPSTWHNDLLTPQPQPENGGKGYRTDLGDATTKAMALYMEDTNWIDWGKGQYFPGQNGGIAGMIFYQEMRTEIDPALTKPTWWSTGVPRAKLNLYADANGDGVPDGPPIQTTYSKGWDDNFPTGCVNNDGLAKPFSPYIDCAEFIRTWGQVRPGVYNGLYEFKDLPLGKYIVEVVPPIGYKIVKEEDQNIAFGDPITPSKTLALTTKNPSTTWPCVGQPHHIPQFLVMFPDFKVPSINLPYDNTLVTPLCDRKEVTLTDGLNANADFPLFSDVPRAARISGLVTNDLVLEFNPSNPRKGDKLGPAWMPIAIRDWAGNEIGRVYTDEFGQYNTMVPSSYIFNAPDPSGFAPGVITISLNDPGPIPALDSAGQPIIDQTTGQTKMVTDPFYNPAYVQFASNWDVWPGKTTFTDTPILPIAAFTQSHGRLDCEQPNGTPIISQVNGPAGGPYVQRTGSLLRIASLGTAGVLGGPRDFGFGTKTGTVTIDGVTLDPINWTNEVIVVRVPAGARTGQLAVTRGDNGQTSAMGITVHIGGGVSRVATGRTIQQTIDASNPGDLILVPPGVYKENLIMWKPVQLQGYGVYATAINGGFFDTAAQAVWTAKVTALQTAVGPGLPVKVVPGERADFFLERGAGILVLSDNVTFQTTPSLIDGLLITGAVQGSGLDVNAYAHNLVISNNRVQSNQGFFGGGIRLGTPSIVLTDAQANPVAGASTFNSNENTNIKIRHNQVDQNGAATEGGGIGIYNGADNIAITQNYICGNFSAGRAGGIQLLGLSDNAVIDNNVILLNEAFTDGGGILLTGEIVPVGAPAGSRNVGTGNVTINRNLIQGNHAGEDGGGIRTQFVNGQDVVANPLDNTQWYRLDILNNMIVNNVGSHLAGGIALADAANANIIHNTISQNDSTATGTGSFGGPCNPQFQFICGPEGIIEGLGGGTANSVAQAAGLVSQPHYATLVTAFDNTLRQTYSNPVLYNNIIWHNRSFFWNNTINGNNGGLLPTLDNVVYWDLHVYTGGPGMVLQPKYGLQDNSTILDNTVTLDNTSVTLDPKFVSPYFNVFEATSVGASMGNYVQINYSPLSLTGNYRLQKTSPAIDRAFAGFGTLLPGWLGTPLLNIDYDGLTRPFDVLTVPNNPSPADIGAAEFRP